MYFRRRVRFFLKRRVFILLQKTSSNSASLTGAISYETVSEPVLLLQVQAFCLKNSGFCLTAAMNSPVCLSCRLLSHHHVTAVSVTTACKILVHLAALRHVNVNIVSALLLLCFLLYAIININPTFTTAIVKFDLK